MKIYNTLTRKKEEFKPIKDNLVRIYTCGPTVYNYAHIGNLRSYVFEDLLKRTLLYNGFKIKHVMNITDVGHLTSDADTGEDKLEKGAKREGKTAWEIAEFYTKTFKEDIKKLNIIEPNIWCKATDHINEQINLIRTLEKKGFTYKLEDGIYFDTSKLKNYGKLARLDIKGLKEGARIDIGEKRNKTDFALWKFSKHGEKRDMEWNSPWGIGFPGWHIECSAMSMKYLGETFDIHCGGIDHIPIHHTNEIAQSEAASGKKFVNYWMHCEFLILDKGKMSKSLGNFITLESLEKEGFDPLDYRYLCLNTHYRKRLVFSFENLKVAKNSLDRLKNIILEIKDKKDSKGSIAEYKEKFLEVINDDLNVPRGLALLWNILRDNHLGSKEKYQLILEFDKILGLSLKNIKENKVSKEIQELINEREKARKAKDWKKADSIRTKLKEKGIVLEDTKEGFKIKTN